MLEKQKVEDERESRNREAMAVTVGDVLSSAAALKKPRTYHPSKTPCPFA